MNLPEVISEKEWQRAHEELLAKEKAHIREGDRLAADDGHRPAAAIAHPRPLSARRAISESTRVATISSARARHLGVNDPDYARRRELYEKALAPLGITLLVEPIGGTGGFGRDRQALLLDDG